MVGLGRMGANMTKRLVEAGHEIVAYDRNPEAVAAAEEDGAVGAESLEALVEARVPPARAGWVMVPAGDPTTSAVDAVAGLLANGDTIVDGGNSNFKAAMATSARLAERGISFVDAGVSGGVWGLKNGYCLMVGGPAEAVSALEPIFTDLAPPGGYAHVGPSGAGHYSKMIHNGIEYGMLQAYAEGFALLDRAGEFDFDLHALAKLWNRGSVVRSWLLELAELALKNEGDFKKIKGVVADSGEGRWTVEEAVGRGVAAPVITAALFARFSTQTPDSFAARIVAALRNQFGGHAFFTEAGAAEAQKADEGPGAEVSPEGASTEATA